jgi:Na+/H+ antiporter NhaD/arsenite permease-like protein
MDVQMILSIVIFVVSYVFIALDKVDKTIVALTGAVLMILVRILNQDFAFKEAVDYNTLSLLVGMMVIVMILKRTGIFEYLAIKTVKLAKGEPLKILVLLSIITGLLSALLDNVTTILLILPVTLSIAKDLKISPIPFILTSVFASNTGGAATLIGDPPNILIGSQVGLTFLDFLKNNAVIAIPILFVTTFIFAWKYKKQLVVPDSIKKSLMEIDETQYIKDSTLLWKGGIVIGITMLGFILHGQLHYESGTIAFAGGVLLLLLSKLRAEEILHEVDTIFFFIGLFILVGGIKQTGVIKMLASGVLSITNGNLALTTIVILWGSAIASAFINNIPFVATMINMVKEMGAISGMPLNPIWWALSLGACLGGNGTIIGASANVIAVDMAAEAGCKISFGQYLKEAFPMMLLTILISTVYLYFAYSGG